MREVRSHCVFKLPFGEELYAGVDGRLTTQGYTGDGVRQKFTGYETDAETVLNFAQARYQSTAQGRFTTPDTVAGSIASPQTLNLYAYVSNNPLRYVDPTGHSLSDIGVLQTEDPEDAKIAEHQGLNGLQTGVNSDYVARHPQSQNPETGADLAQRAATGLSNNPGLLEEIQANTASGVDVHIVACQAAKESNYAGLSQIPIPSANAGNYTSGAVGGDGEIGLLQIFPSTAGVSAQALKSVGTNVKAATSYLMGIKNHFDVGMREALAIYNWGPGKFNRVDRNVNKIFSGSLSYADKILDCSRQLYLPSDGNPYKFLPR